MKTTIFVFLMAAGFAAAQTTQAAIEQVQKIKADTLVELAKIEAAKEIAQAKLELAEIEAKTAELKKSAPATPPPTPTAPAPSVPTPAPVQPLVGIAPKSAAIITLTSRYQGTDGKVEAWEASKDWAKHDLKRATEDRKKAVGVAKANRPKVIDPCPWWRGCADREAVILGAASPPANVVVVEPQAHGSSSVGSGRGTNTAYSTVR